MQVKKIAMGLGVVLTLVGILGFVPVFVINGNLLGIFAVDTLHNIVHLASGLIAIAAAKTDDYARMYFKVFGVIYTLVTVLGFTAVGADGTLLGLISINLADNLLHIAISVLSLYLGFGTKSSARPVQA